ncbi:hypothetical protein KEM55_006355, partial [Ascosphaera atra]
TITSETDKITAALAALETQLKDSPFLRWESAANMPKEMHDICKKAVQFFEMHEQASKDAAECTEELDEMMRLQWKLLANLEGLKEFNHNEARGRREDEAEKEDLPHKVAAQGKEG